MGSELYKPAAKAARDAEEQEQLAPPLAPSDSCWTPSPRQRFQCFFCRADVGLWPCLPCGALACATHRTARSRHTWMAGSVCIACGVRTLLPRENRGPWGGEGCAAPTAAGGGPRYQRCPRAWTFRGSSRALRIASDRARLVNPSEANKNNSNPNHQLRCRNSPLALFKPRHAAQETPGPNQGYSSAMGV